MDVSWLLQDLHGLFDVVLILDSRSPFLRCSGTCIRLRETFRALVGAPLLPVRRECLARDGVFCYLLWIHGEAVCLHPVEI